MKLFLSPAILALAATPVTASLFKSNNALVDDSDIVQPSHMVVSCQGVNFMALSPAQEAFAAQQLMGSYNSVHAVMDDGDFSIEGITWEGPDEMVAETFVDKKGKKKNKNKPAAFCGSFRCCTCPDDDDALGGFVLTNGASHRAWEAAFTAALLESGKPSFRQANSCQINVKPASACGRNEMIPSTALVTQEEAATIRDEDNAVTQPSHTVVKCDGINLPGMSLEQKLFLAKEVRDTYNKVHAITDDGDKTIVDIHYEGMVPNDNMVEKKKGKDKAVALCGSFRCCTCPDDDDATTWLASSTGNALRAWEYELQAALLASGRDLFSNCGKCSITVKPAAACKADEDMTAYEAAAMFLRGAVN